jgi:hypothetical protein
MPMACSEQINAKTQNMIRFGESRKGYDYKIINK